VDRNGAKGVGDVSFPKESCRSQGDQQVRDYVNRLILYPKLVRVDAIVNGGTFGKGKMLNRTIFRWIGMLLGNDSKGAGNVRPGQDGGET
jgi:hypothetical protein